MNERLSSYFITSWPIWLKLLAGFLIAVILPLVLISYLLLNGIRDAGRQNVEAYIAENGSRQWEAINTAFDVAQDELDNFVKDQENRVSMIDLLPLNTAVDVSPVGKAAFINQVQDQILNTAANPFTKVELINGEGRLVLQALPGRSTTLAVSEDRSQSLAYQAGVNSSLLRREQDIVVYNEGDNVHIEVVNVISLTTSLSVSDTTGAIGYLVASIDVPRIIYNNLIPTSDFFGATSYLVAPNGTLITSEGSQRLAISQAQQLFSGDTYLTTASGDILRYSVPIAGTPFRLVSEGSADAVSGGILQYLTTRGFVLAVGLLGLITVLVISANYLITPPLKRIKDAIQAIAYGNYAMPLPDLNRGDEIGELAGAVADVRQRIAVLVGDLENRIDARTRDITTTQEISHFAATQRDLQTLMNQVVDLIVQRFPNIYHAQIFLTDSDSHYAVLRASTGAPGRQLLQAGHRLAVGSMSVIGQVTQVGAEVVARDTTDSHVHKRNEFLPDTLAELAIPLKLSDNRVIGALDVQSKESDSFSQDEIEILRMMADQITVAIENARLYQESLRNLEEIERNRRATTLQAWREYMKQERTRTKESESGMRPANQVSPQLRQQAMTSGKSVVGTVTDRRTIPIVVPIRLGDQVLGVVQWELPQENFDQGRILLAEELTNRLALSLDNTRLFQESQRATDRERLVNEIAARLTNQTDIDQILQTAVREVGQALRSPQVSIRLAATEQHGATNGIGNGHSVNGHSKTSRLSEYYDEQ